MIRYIVFLIGRKDPFEQIDIAHFVPQISIAACAVESSASFCYTSEEESGTGAQRAAKWWEMRMTMLEDIQIIRATETWQQAGAYYVRIQAMAKKHHITLRQEFDAHDTPQTKYIVALDADFPVATARMYEMDRDSMMIGRIVVLPEYRHQGIGSAVITECEKWAAELGYEKAVLDSRDNKVNFYRQLGYAEAGEPYIDGETFRCIRMQKRLIPCSAFGSNGRQ